MASTQGSVIKAVEWADGGLRLLDQRILPGKINYLFYKESSGVASAIREMVVRGAPAIGIAAAYGVVCAARRRFAISPGTWQQEIAADFAELAGSRPTAVNLRWALDRMKSRLGDISGDPEPALLAEARRIQEEDIAANRRMGELGAQLIDQRCAVLTHCNAGALATGGYGTALGVVRAAYASGHISLVYADETRPWLQGSRLTAWELVQDHIPVTLIGDGAAAHLLRQGGVKWIIVGADRIAANGDAANKIGTYNLAVVARHHGVKFMVVAPTSTIDMQTATGHDIPIEERAADELLSVAGVRIAAEGAQAWNPVFDVTPADLIDVIVTEKGVVAAPDARKMAALMKAAR
ncbi:MAG: methylthioribose-1-phosphate isomerase [Gammaproteobacteria bacterium]|nr:MAG: methylthioribose-1-phosphate isomerase [Gammaproteobacteria bacterium]TND07055.1 MAG: methylthioribose-1-phosphate isomerase [Gammaproteobacteria bacterium]